MLLYGAAGACIVGIPLVVLLLLQISSNAVYRQQARDYRQLEKQGLYLRVWTLKQDKSAGEKVTRTDLEEKKQWVSESEEHNVLTDIRRIIGKKAKTALKKGTVIQSGLLYSKKKTG